MELSMNLTLAIVTAAAPDGFHVETLDGRALLARPSRRVQGRIRIVAHQLVVVDEAPAEPEVVWRWFRGPVLLIADGHAVVDYRPYQAGFRYPLGVVAVPAHLGDAVDVGSEVFYTHGEGGTPGAIAAVLRDGRPHDPAVIAVELFPAVEQLYAEEGGA
jgi:hypothetical protein